ncbi:hypothetical protein GGF31_006152 [Allomyces arbusculus]|nr:hypothetical protein GGF31_006152 [Allomyces arbusculus]
MPHNHRHAQAVIQGPTLYTAQLIQSGLKTDDDVHDRVHAVRHTPQFSRRSSEKFALLPRAPKIARIGFGADVTEDDDISCNEIILPVHPARLLREQRACKAARVGIVPDVTQDDDVSRDQSVLLVHPVRQSRRN